VPEAPISGPTLIRNCRDGALVTNRGWNDLSKIRYPLPRGGRLVTLEDKETTTARDPMLTLALSGFSDLIPGFCV
jgi:hypothetical protein